MEELLGRYDHIQLAIIVSIGAGVLLLYLLLAPKEEAAVDYQVPVPEQCNAAWGTNIQPLPNPSLKTDKSSAIQCYCPANGKPLGRINPATADGIDRAVAKAAEAQVIWAKTSFAQRRRVLKTFLKYVLKHQDDIVRAACLDSGKTRVDASFGEILTTAEKLNWTIKHGEQALKSEKRPTNFLMFYKHNEVRWEPLGVAAACVSWNYPFHNVVGPIISALFTGNAIIVKASEQTAWSSVYFTSIVRGALEACNQPPALVQSVVCWPSVAPHLTSHPGIAHITFIGSRPVAHHIASAASKSLTPLCLELGGKDAAIILDDVKDLNTVVSIFMRGVFQSAGQNCIGIERAIVLPRTYARLLPILKQRIDALRVGSALDDEEDVDVGACISPANFDRLEDLINDAVSRGARLLCGGARYTHPKWPQGHFFAPTLLVDVTADMPIAQQELFAPIFVLMQAGSVDEAIAMTNAAPFGLGCSVFGSSAKDLEKVTQEVKVGMVAVNDFATYYMCGLPFGGVGGSGYGRFGGEEGLRSLCNLKSVCKDRWSLISTSIPPRLDYPKGSTAGAKKEVGAKKKGWEFAKALVDVAYAGWSESVTAVLRIIKNS